MREPILIAVVALLCAIALFKPRIGLYGYIWFALMQPDALAWSYGKYPFSMALAVATLIGSIRYLPNVLPLLWNPVVRMLLLLQIPIVLSVVFARDPALSYDPLQLYVRIIVMSLLIPVLIQSESDMKWLFLVMGFSVGLLGLKFGLYGLLQGGVTYSYGHVGSIGDNNDFALALAMAVPLCWYGRLLVPSWVGRWLVLGILFATISAIVMTHSRGGALSLLGAILAIAYHEKRRVAMLFLILLLAVPAVYLVQDTYVHRMSTLEAPVLDDSANHRILYAEGALRLWRDYPMLGVGFGMDNQRAVWHNYVQGLSISTAQVVHNTYLQMLADCGLPALVIYLSLLFGTILRLRSSAVRTKKAGSGLDVYPMALQGSLLAFAVGSTFLSRTNFDFTYMLLMTAAAWLPLERKLLSAKAAAASPPRPAVKVAVPLNRDPVAVSG